MKNLILSHLYQDKETFKLFEDRKVRTVWDDKEETRCFSVVDVVGVLTD